MFFFCFSVDEDAEEEEEGQGKFDKNTMPENVVCLEADDSFLRQRYVLKAIGYRLEPK